MGFFGGGAKKSQAQQTPSYTSLRVQTSVLGLSIPIVFGRTRIAPNLIWYGDFTAIAHQSEPPGAGKGGGGSGGGSVTYTYQTALAMALCEGPIGGVGRVWIGKKETTAPDAGFTIFTGSYSQTAWGYLTTNHPGQDLAYRGLAYAAAAPYDLGDNADLNNHGFEVNGLQQVVPGSVDSDPALVVQELLTNVHFGAGFPAARLGDLSTYSLYCRATGLLVSPAYTEQIEAAQMLRDLTELTNSELVWSQGVLTVVPYGDQAATGFGASYTPPTQPLYDLTDDDFIRRGEDDPVRLTRRRPADAYNAVRLEYLNRATGYAAEPVEVKNEAAIDLYGLRPEDTKQAHIFADANAAKMAATLRLQRQSVVNEYTFTLGWRYCLLDAMDIVTITDAALGLAQQWVRIKTIEEDDDGALLITAEEYLAGTGGAPLYAFGASTGYSVNYNAPANAANAPILFDAPVELADSGGLEIWAAVSGDAGFGGCEIWVSSDDATYKLVGRTQGSARTGVLTASLASGADPDTIHTLSVSLAQSRGTLLSGTQDDADSFHTLCWVDGELISYRTAVLTGTNAYDLTYLRRGAYEMSPAAHASGARFARIDDGVFAVPYTKDQIGKTLYLKFPAFNIFGGGEQALADCVAYTHVITGPAPPANVTNFAAQQQGGSVALSWDKINSFALTGYDIRFAPAGTSDWDAMTPVTEAGRGTEMTTIAVPPGKWVFAIRGRDVADQLSPIAAFVSLTVTTVNSALFQQEQSPDWLGTMTGFVKHWTGRLVPDSNSLANANDDNVFAFYVHDPVAVSEYISNVVTLDFADTVRVWAGMDVALGPNVTEGLPIPQLFIKYTTGSSDPAMWNADANTLMWNADANTPMWGGYTEWIPWTVGEVQNLLSCQFKLRVEAAIGVDLVKGFLPTLDHAPVTEMAQGVAVAIGGTTITFPKPFHQIPYVNATALGTSGASVVITSITKTNFVARVFQGASDVGGTINWDATG